MCVQPIVLVDCVHDVRLVQGQTGVHRTARIASNAHVDAAADDDDDDLCVYVFVCFVPLWCAVLVECCVSLNSLGAARKRRDDNHYTLLSNIDIYILSEKYQELNNKHYKGAR